MVSPRLRQDQRGQATVEYILLLSTLVAFFVVVRAGLERMQITDRLMAPIEQDFARTYRYGHPKAKGYPDGEPYNEGGPEHHPRIWGGSNFRVFLNPRAN